MAIPAPIEPAQLQPCAKQARLDGRDAQTQRFRCFLGRKSFHVTQNKHNAKSLRQSLDGLAQNLRQFGLVVILLRIRSPVGEVAGNAALFGRHILVHGDQFARAPLAQPHQTLVYRDSYQPCVKFRVPLKLIELLIGFEKRILHYVFGVFAVLRNVLRNPEELPLVLADQRVIGREIPGANPLYEGDIGVLFANWLDGRHGNRMRKIAILTRRERSGSP